MCHLFPSLKLRIRIGVCIESLQGDVGQEIVYLRQEEASFKLLSVNLRALPHQDLIFEKLLKSQIAVITSKPLLSSSRAKRTGPKGLRAESARAVTGRRCPLSGKGEDFLMGQLNFFTETAVTPEQKVEKLIPRWEINRHDKG